MIMHYNPAQLLQMGGSMVARGQSKVDTLSFKTKNKLVMLYQTGEHLASSVAIKESSLRKVKSFVQCPRDCFVSRKYRSLDFQCCCCNTTLKSNTR